MSVLKGWTPAPFANSRPDTQGDLCCVTRDGAGFFAVHSSFVKQSLEGLPLASAVCAIAADLAQGYFEARPGSLTLHCGAFQLGGDLIALTGRARAGKSTLIARLAMEPSVQVFCDDVLPVDDDGCGVALGIAPRIRIPLPNAISARFRDFIGEHAGPVDDQYGYVVSDTVAPHGAKARLAAIVELNRRPRARAKLHRLDAADAVQLIAEQNMADLLTARLAFDQISTLVSGIRHFSLVYSDLDEAVDLLRRNFGKGPACNANDAIIPSRRRIARKTQTAPFIQDCRSVWKRGDGVDIRLVAGAAFLFRGDDKTLWRMNEMATAVWLLLEEPSSIDEIAYILSEAFPQTPRTKLQNDVTHLFDTLACEDLVVKREKI